MCLLYLVEQQHAVRRLADGIRQQTSVLVTHVARRRSDQLSHRMFLSIFAHIETQQRDAQFFSKHTSHFRLTHSRRTHKQQ